MINFNLKLSLTSIKNDTNVLLPSISESSLCSLSTKIHVTKCGSEVRHDDKLLFPVKINASIQHFINWLIYILSNNHNAIECCRIFNAMLYITDFISTFDLLPFYNLFMFFSLFLSSGTFRPWLFSVGLVHVRLLFNKFVCLLHNSKK